MAFELIWLEGASEVFNDLHQEVKDCLAKKNWRQEEIKKIVDCLNS